MIASCWFSSARISAIRACNFFLSLRKSEPYAASCINAWRNMYESGSFLTGSRIRSCVSCWINWASVSGSFLATAASVETRNFRPIVAAICATDFAAAFRSSRAINDASSVSGTRMAPPILLPSRTATVWVSSSTKSGTPSAFAIMSRNLASGMEWVPSAKRAISMLSPSDKRFSPTCVSQGKAGQFNSKSGLCVVTSMTGSFGGSVTRRERNSNVVGSAQWISSSSINTGPAAARFFSISFSKANIASFCCAAFRASRVSLSCTPNCAASNVEALLISISFRPGQSSIRLRV